MESAELTILKVGKSTFHMVQFVKLWELRSQDRRVGHSASNSLYKIKKLQIRQIQNSASIISLQKCKTKGKKSTAGDLKSDDYVDILLLIHTDEGFRVLRKGITSLL